MDDASVHRHKHVNMHTEKKKKCKWREVKRAMLPSNLPVHAFKCPQIINMNQPDTHYVYVTPLCKPAKVYT